MVSRLGWRLGEPAATILAISLALAHASLLLVLIWKLEEPVKLDRVVEYAAELWQLLCPPSTA